MINTLKIKGRIAELGLKQGDIASKLGLSPATVSQKINGLRPMSLDEAEKIADILRIPDSQFKEFFLVS